MSASQRKIRIVPAPKPFWAEKNKMPRSNHTLYVLGDIMSQYSIDLLRAFNSDGDISEARWRSGIDGIRSWNNEVLNEEVKALRAIDADVDKVILQAVQRYAPRTTEVKVAGFLRHFMGALAQTSEVLDRTLIDELSFDDRANIFRRLTRRALYLCCQNRVGPSDSISQVMFRNRKGALTSWRSSSGSAVSTLSNSSNLSSSNLSTKPRPPSSPRKRRRKKPEPEPEPEIDPPSGSAIEEDSYEVSRCFEKLDRFAK